MEQVHVVTESGFECDISRKKLEDMRFIDLLDELDEGNTLAISRLVTYLLGKDGKERLYAHLADNDGYVSSKAVSEEIAAIFSAFGDAEKK